MKNTIFYLWTLLLMLSLRGVYSQWENFPPVQRDQDASRIFQYQQDELQMVHPGSVIADDNFQPTKYLQYKDFVTIENPPKRAKSNHTLKVKYQCSQSLIIILFAEGNFLRLKEPRVNTSLPLYKDSDIIFFRKYWPCARSLRENKISLPLTFPKELLWPPNVLMPKVWTMKDVNLKIAMVEKHLWTYLESAEYLMRDVYHIAYDKSLQSLRLPIKVKHPYKRTKKDFGRSFTWPFEIHNMNYKNNLPMSPKDDVATRFLSHPVVSSYTQFGLPRNFLRFKNPEMRLENKYKEPKFTFSVVLYLTSPCQDMCAVSQHIGDEDKFDTSVIFLTKTGKIHVQGKVADNNSYAFFSEWEVPVREWVRIDVQQFSVLLNMTLRHGKDFSETKNSVQSFHLPMKQDYMAGYFTAGASMFSRSIDGIIGDVKFWRNMLITSEEIPLPNSDEEMFHLGIEEALEKSDEVQELVDHRWSFLSSQFSNETEKQKPDICLPYFIELIRPQGDNKTDQCPIDSKPLPSRFRSIETQLIKLSRKRKKRRDVNVHDEVGDKLYDAARKLLESTNRITRMGPVISLLENAAMLKHGPSCFLLYVIYENGFGVDNDTVKARKYLYSGALYSDRMAIKTLAYKYFSGIDGFPQDKEIAFYYYFNAAHQSQMDRQTHAERMTDVNRVRLTDERQLKQQTAEDEDLFQWFKHQAGTGMREAKRNLGQLLYWGKQGLKRNLKAAFEYYEQAAQDTDDPNALYDYGITLMKGHGTDVDEERGLEVLLKAADKKSPSAYNTLGWYYIRKDGEKKRAVEYFEKAAELNNIDATYNLGHMHHIGDYPGEERNLKKAFQLYYKAASRGHVESSVRLSHMFACGIRDYLYRNVHSACFWSKPVAELSPVMGEIVREALQSFRSGLWTKSTLLYLAAAETGFEPAGYNTAFLCDEDKSKLVRANIKNDCVWRFWNASAHQYAPAPYALNKMGDYYYYGITDTPDLEQAIKYYVTAARLRDPQALFNMACILEEHGDRVDNKTLEFLALPEGALRRREDTIVELYQICSSIGSEENSMPCYMGLIRMKSIVMWKYSSLMTKVIASLTAIVLSTIVVFASSFLRHQRRTDNVVLTEQGSAEESSRTHILQEEIIENEITRKTSNVEESENENDDLSRQDIRNTDAQVKNLGAKSNGVLSLAHNGLDITKEVKAVGKSSLEESTDDDDENFTLEVSSNHNHNSDTESNIDATFNLQNVEQDVADNVKSEENKKVD